MKQKYEIKKDPDKKTLIISEYLQLEKGVYSFVCKESYDIKSLKKVAKDKKLLIATLRTNNIFPANYFADKLASAVKPYISNKKQDVLELFFDDLEIIPKEEKIESVKEEVIEEIKDDVLFVDEEKTKIVPAKTEKKD